MPAVNSLIAEIQAGFNLSRSGISTDSRAGIEGKTIQ
jgi:hypothetical protein